MIINSEMTLKDLLDAVKEIIPNYNIFTIMIEYPFVDDTYKTYTVVSYDGNKIMNQNRYNYVWTEDFIANHMTLRESRLYYLIYEIIGGEVY
jgi:hypothetical protein